MNVGSGRNDAHITKDQISPLKINQNCTSCGGNASFVNKAFKIACLNYASSKITFDEEVWSRNELLQRKLSLVHKSRADAELAKLYQNDAQQMQLREPSAATLMAKRSSNSPSTMNLVPHVSRSDLETMRKNEHDKQRPKTAIQ
jgi:hypothetical protein